MRRYIDKSAFEKQNKLDHTKSYTSPTYYSRFINTVNQDAQATRPATVGELATTIFPDYSVQSTTPSPDDWKKYYLERYQSNYDLALEKLKAQFQKEKEAINNITDRDLENWLNDLMFYKTYTGLYIQDAILTDLAEAYHSEYKKPTAEEEGQGIDGYINGIAYSVKPESYKTSPESNTQKISAKLIFYKYNKAQDSNKVKNVEYYVQEEEEEEGGN